MPPRDKILPLEDVIIKVKDLKKQGKRVVQSHGVFDIIHPGIIRHLEEARRMGDVLVVSVIRDRDVRRGSGRPVFPDEMRVENVAALEQVDYACVVEDEVPFQSVKQIAPDIFARGTAYKERDRKIHQRIFEEERELYFGKSKILETSGFSFSSSQIINNFLHIYPEETSRFIQKFAEKYAFDFILEKIGSLADLNVLIIGDGIIDEYHYCSPMGKSAKAQLVVNRFLAHEVFAGGVFAIANHVSQICDNVNLVTLLGREDSREEFIAQNINTKVRTKFFYRDDGPTIIKKRYVDGYSNQKLFEVNFLNDERISERCETEVLDYLIQEIPPYDLVLVSDFGHGFITHKMIKILQKLSRVLAVNTQSNAANTGFNMITKYHKPDYVCLDETEARLTMQNKFDDIRTVAEQLSNLLDVETLIVTLGKRGSIAVGKGGRIQLTPIFSSKVVDTVGAGDAFFSYTAPCFAKRLPLDLMAFIGNAVGAIAVQVVCNKKPVEQHELLQFVHTILNQRG